MGATSVKIILLLMLSVSTFTESKTTPIHSHKKENDVKKERESDGAFSPTPRRHRSQDFENHLEDADDEHHSEFDHEAILGNRDTAEEYDNLPPDEAKKRLKILAFSKDINKDGEINRTELIQWILESFKMLNQEDSEERHEESDANEDGFVTWDEYVEENYGISNLDENSEMNIDEASEEKKMLEEDRELFRVSDLNGDKKLSKEEFLSFTHPEEFPYSSEVLIKRMMIERDLDGDGFLSLKEFLTGEDAINKDKDWVVSEKDKFDNDYDLNRDGRLGPEEVLRWLSPDDRESAEQEADHLIESADDNSDGKLSIQEIVDHHDIFVGSEATDYGQQLHDLYLTKEEL